MFLWQYQAVTQRDLSSSNAHWKKSSQKISNNSKDRSSRPEVFCKKDVFRNFAKFTGSYPPILRLNLKNSTMSLYFNSLPFKNLRKNLFPHMIPIHPTLEAATGGALYKKGVLRNVSKLTGKHLCQSLFCNKVAGLWDSGTGVFLWILRNFSEKLFYRTRLGNCF